MNVVPETRYAWNGDVSLAYQVVGTGPIDMLYLQGYASHVDLNWESPRLASFLRSLARSARLIVTDRRGWGCSDRFSPYDIAPLESLTDDLVAVMEAAGSERAVVFGTQECGIVASLFAASYPARTQGLILCDPFARYDSNDPAAGPMTDEDWGAALDLIRSWWGRAEWVRDWPDPRERKWFPRYAHAAIPPGGLLAEMQRYRHLDPAAAYPTINVPTLILTTTGGDPIFSAENGRHLATVIPNARLVQHDFVERPWLHWYRRAGAVVAEVVAFLDRVRDEEALLDRVLATVLFTDIVDSTQRAADLGDRRWRELVERHHAMVRTLLGRFRGEEIDTAGDGFFASFDGPGRAIRCAEAIRSAVRTLGVEVRCGIHAGECELIDGKLGGLTVHTGARIGALAGPSEILVSDTVRALVIGSDLVFEDRGIPTLKGIPESPRVHALVAEPG